MHMIRVPVAARPAVHVAGLNFAEGRFAQRVRQIESAGGSEEGGIDEARQRQRCHMRQTRELARSAEEF